MCIRLTDWAVVLIVLVGLSGSATALADQSGGETAAESGRPTARLEEIIVTAEKRGADVFTVPTALTAISGDRLENLQITSLVDLADYVPGMSVSSYGSPGQRVVVLRGLNDSYVNDLAGPLVGTYIDDLPVNSSTAQARGNLFGLDLLPYDIERVEVLKGPQGTLYGGNAMGGLVKYALRKPNLSSFEARVGGDLEYTDGMSQPGGSVRASANLPIVSDRLAARFSGFYQDTAGYIDNVGTAREHANRSKQTGGRAALLFQPFERLSIELNILAQTIESDDQTLVTLDGATLKPLYGRQKVFTYFPQPFEQQTRNYSVDVNWDFGFAHFVNALGYSTLNSSLNEDFSVPFGELVPGHSDALTLYEVYDHVKKFVEEARLQSSGAHRLQWMMGAFYTDERAGEKNNWPAFTPSLQPLPLADNLYIQDTASVYKEAAGFGNLTFNVSDRFDVSGGIRHSQYQISSCPGTYAGLFGVDADGNPTVNPCSALPSTGVTTWMGNARVHLTADAILYGRVATGYRPGQGCPTCGNAALGTPGVVRPDRTRTYEIGAKGAFLDHRLQLDSSIFYIDWRDIQLNELTSNGMGFTGNGGTASSQGIELSGAYQLMHDLRFGANIAFTNAHLTEDALGAGGKQGDPLPVTPRWTSVFTADYSHKLSRTLTVLLGGSYRYRDAAFSQFAGNPGPSLDPRAPLPVQNLVDLYAGVAHDHLTVRFYGKNVFNNRSYAGLMFMNNPARPNYVPVLPATAGLSLDYQF